MNKKSIEDWYNFWFQQTEKINVELGNSLGFNPPLLSGIDTLFVEPRILVITLNPAGDRDYIEHRGYNLYKGKNAYLDIAWRHHPKGEAPLQRQMRSLFEYVERRVVNLGDVDAFARQRIVTSQLIPFRSKSEQSLLKKEEALSFCNDMWGELFKIWYPDVVIAIGQTTYQQMKILLMSENELPPENSGWGRSVINRSYSELGARIIGLPHLSRFAIFNRKASVDILNCVFDWAFNIK